MFESDFAACTINTGATAVVYDGRHIDAQPQRPLPPTAAPYNYTTRVRAAAVAASAATALAATWTTTTTTTTTTSHCS